MDINPGQPLVPKTASRQDIVYLDPAWERPVSQYSPEGEIWMMGELASGLRRRGRISRPMALGLVLVILIPIVLSVIAVVTTW
jgi:hypothetical protein